MTSTEKSRTFRDRQRAAGNTQRSIYLPKGQPTPSPEDLAAFVAWREGKAPEPQIMTPDAVSILDEKVLKARMKEERRIVRTITRENLTKGPEHDREEGRIQGICEAAAFLVSHNRRDAGTALLIVFDIDRTKADEAMRPDKRFINEAFDTLDKAGVWKEPSLDLDKLEVVKEKPLQEELLPQG
jgi:hypothetical protein